MKKKPFQIVTLPTGVPNFDTILGGGIPEASLSIVAGLAGSGKTTLVQQIAFTNGTAARPAVYFNTLGEPTVKLLRYQQQFAFFDPAKVGSAVHFIDIGHAASEGGEKGALAAIGEQVERLAPGLIAVDSFRAVGDLTGGSQSAKRIFTHDLAVLLTTWNCTAFLVGEYAEQEVGLGPEFTVADNVLFLSQELQRNSVVRRLRVVKARGLAPVPGRHAFHITEEGLHVYPRLLPLAESVRQRKGARATFGIDTLDEMMRGGVPRGQACIVAGSAGTGKTLLALHFAVAGAAAGEACVMVTFEESPAEHAEKMAAFGWNLADLERRGLIEMVYLRPVDLSIDEVINSIIEAVERRKARRVIINSVSGMEIALAQTERAELREGLYRMTAQLTARGLVVLLTTEVPDFLGELRLSTEGLSFIADNIILLRYVEIAAELRRALTIVKMRTSAHENLLREYRIGKKGITVEQSYKDYSGILTGVPTLRSLLEPRPYTAGLDAEEETAMHTLLAMKQASAEELAQALGVKAAATRGLLDRLTETGYVVRSTQAGRRVYRIALLTPGGRPQRRKG